MNATDTQEQQETERPERAVLVRRFEAQLTAGDGRTVDMRIVPFGERATVADGYGGVPKGVPYQEEWMPGVFDKQLQAAHRVWLNFEHQPGLAGVIGKGMALRHASDGYHGSFRVLPGADGDKALALIHEDVLTGASVEAIPQKSIRSAAGVVQRVKAHLDAVALCRVGAFSGALVTAVRTDELMFDEDMLPAALDPAIVDRCRSLGIAVPDGLTSTVARASSAAEQKAVGRLEMMIATAKNYIADEPDQADKDAMAAIVTELQRLHTKDTSPAG